MKERRKTIHHSCKSVWEKLEKKEKERENKENDNRKKWNKKKKKEKERKRIWKQMLVHCGEWCRHHFWRNYQDTWRITMIPTQLGSDFVDILQTGLITRAKCWRTIVKRSRWSRTIRAPRENNKKQQSSDFFNLWFDRTVSYEIASLSFCNSILSISFDILYL